MSTLNAQLLDLVAECAAAPAAVATKSTYGRGWDPIDLTGPLGEVEVLIEMVVETLRERHRDPAEVDTVRENLEELSANYHDFMEAVEDYIGDEYALYTSPADYMRAEALWAEYKIHDWVMS